MTNADIISDLRTRAALLMRLSRQSAADFEPRLGELTALIHNAEAREHRRAAFNARDASCYRLGSSFEPAGGLDLDPVALTGWLALGSTGVLLLVRVALANPQASLPDQLTTLFRSPAGRGIHKWGIWIRWVWLKNLYQNEVEAFLLSPNGQNKNAAWRRKPASARQGYLIAEICGLLQKEPQVFATRGEAFDWILAQNGNPKFRVEPDRASLDDLLEAIA